MLTGFHHGLCAGGVSCEDIEGVRAGLGSREPLHRWKPPVTGSITCSGGNACGCSVGVKIELASVSGESKTMTYAGRELGLHPSANGGDGSGMLSPGRLAHPSLKHRKPRTSLEASRSPPSWRADAAEEAHHSPSFYSTEVIAKVKICTPFIYWKTMTTVIS